MGELCPGDDTTSIQILKHNIHSDGQSITTCLIERQGKNTGTFKDSASHNKMARISRQKRISESITLCPIYSKLQHVTSNQLT